MFGKSRQKPNQRMKFSIEPRIILIVCYYFYSHHRLQSNSKIDEATFPAAVVIATATRSDARDKAGKLQQLIRHIERGGVAATSDFDHFDQAPGAGATLQHLDRGLAPHQI